jgi:hypothetical protein
MHPHRFPVVLLLLVQVKLTAIQSHGSFVPAMWSASTDPTVMPITNYVECPTESAVIMPVQGTGDKLEAVRRAVIKAFASYVYGVDDYGEYKYELEVPDLDFFPGKLIVKRIDALNLIYAITKVCAASGPCGAGLAAAVSAWSMRRSRAAGSFV